MSELKAEPLSPIDAATLWPQLRSLHTEVVALRTGENLLLASGLAATGMAHLPRIPRTMVLGVRRGLRYRGVVAARELAGGSAWEAVTLRISREKDDETITRLLASAAIEAAGRGGRTLYLRVPEGSPHTTAVHRGGLIAYRTERLWAIRNRSGEDGESPFRAASRKDRGPIFRLYCRAVPAHVRRQEAMTQQEWRAVLDAYDCDHEFVAESERGLVAWCGISDRECRIMIDADVEGLADAVLDLVEERASRHAALVLGEDQVSLESAASDRGYVPLGDRQVCSRRLATLQSIKEVVGVAELAVPHST